MTHIDITPAFWAPAGRAGTVLHLIAEVEINDVTTEYAACATVNLDGVVTHGPLIDHDFIDTLDHFALGFHACIACVALHTVRTAQEVETAVRRAAAAEIRADLVCCDSYDVCRTSARPEELTEYSPTCYWGEAIARSVEGRDVDDECQHPDGTWFDRQVCASPCDKMHTRCVTCGEPADTCEARANSYFSVVEGWRRPRCAGAVANERSTS